MGEPPLFISLLYWPNPAFTKLLRTKLNLQTENYVISFHKIWRRLELKAGNRHEEIRSVAYRYSAKRSFDYICISGISWLMKVFNCR